MTGGVSVPASRPGGWRVAAALIAASALTVAACGAVGPSPKTYVLGPPPTVDEATTAPLLGQPVIEIERVLMPDYLDGSDILVRGSANLVEASRTGRWRERLSVGVGHALAAGLSRRLPEFVIATSAPPETPACELRLDVQAFEADASGRVVFAAQWRVLDGTSDDTLAGERVSLTDPVVGAGDEPVVAAMSRIMEDLAERIATTVRRLGLACAATRNHRSQLPTRTATQKR